MSGISIATRLTRTIGVCAGLATSSLTVVGLPIAMAIGAWRAAYEVMGGHLPVVSRFLPADAPQLLVESALFAWEGLPLSSPPAWGIAVELALHAPLVLAGALLFLNAAMPMGARIRNATGLTGRRQANNSPLQGIVDELRRRSGGPSARVWLIPGRGVQALALSGPLFGHAIVLSDGVVTGLPAAMVRWIVAHEYAHIRHGDTRSGSLWLFGMRSVHLFERLRILISRIVLRLISELPLLALLFLPSLVLVMAMNRIARLGRWFGSRVFLIFDRWAARRMEFAADNYAASMVGAGPGIDLFELLESDLEPRFNGLFATHPSMRARIAKLQAKKTPPVGGVAR